jgi:transposase-like protein
VPCEGLLPLRHGPHTKFLTGPGRPKLLTPEKRKLAVQLYRAKEHSIAEICRLMGISKPTLYSYLAEAGG